MIRALVGAFLFAASAVLAEAAAGMRFDGSTYVSLVEVAERLGLRLGWSASGREMILSDPRHRIEFAEGREAWVDGLRVYFGEPVEVRSGRFYLSQTDYQRRLVPLVRPGRCGPPPRAPAVIAIDAGHGGVDHGTENRRLGLMEKTCTLDVALRLRKLLSDAGYRVVMTRTSDTKIELPIRAVIANQAGADLFVSIHFNSLDRDTATHGTEVYTFPPAGQRSTDSWGHRESDGEREAAPVNRWDAWSAVLARNVHRTVLRGLHTEDRGEKLMHLAVLRNLNCPGILVESAYLSNAAEASRVGSPAFRQDIAEAICAGIQGYAAELDALRGSPAGQRTPPAAAPSAPAAATAAKAGRPSLPLQRPTRPSAAP